MTRMFDTREPSLEALKSAPVYFRYTTPKVHRVLIDALTASAMLAVYNALQEETMRAKFQRMVAGTPRQLSALISFCFQKVTL